MKRLGVFSQRLQQAMSAEESKMTDKEVASVTGVAVRTAQRYMRELRLAGLVRVDVKRHLHHEFGWCNQRTFRFTTGATNGNDVSQGEDC